MVHLNLILDGTVGERLDYGFELLKMVGDREIEPAVSWEPQKLAAGGGVRVCRKMPKIPDHATDTEYIW